MIFILVQTDKLSLTEKRERAKAKKKQEKEPSNLVNEKAKQAKKKNPKKETAEDRVNKEMDKVAAFQARLAKRQNRQKKIRSVVDDSVYESNKKQGKYTRLQRSNLILYTMIYVLQDR